MTVCSRQAYHLASYSSRLTKSYAASWTDHPRDLLHMTNHFRAEMPRPLVALGHSMGGHNIASLSLLHPRLLDALVLIDPVMMRAATRRGHFAEARASTFRRDLWPSRAAAAAAFRKNPFYAQWDPRVLDLWLQHGLRDLPTLVHPSLDAAAVPAATDKKSAINTLASAAAGVIPPVPAPSPLATPVTLTTPKHLEVFTFARPNYPASRSSPSVAPTPSRVTHPDLPDTSMAGADALHPFYRPEPMALFAQLPQLRPRCLYVFAEESHLSAPQHVADKLAVTGVGAGGSGGVREGAVQHVVMKKAGHFVPFERPRDVAELMERFVAREMVRWRREEQELAREWRDRSQRDKVVVDEEWLYWMGTLGKPKI